MKLAEGLAMLELPTDFMGRKGTINPILAWDANAAVLVDAGFPGQAPLIKERMEKAGVPFDRLTHIIITHQDLDHIGSLAALKSMTGDKARVIAHAEETPYIQMEKIPVKFTPERIQQMKNDSKNPFFSSMDDFMAKMKTKVDWVVNDEDEIDLCGGISIIHTPGHTPGHISLYFRKYKLLVTGDAMNLVDGELVGPMPEFTADLDLATASLEKYAAYDIQNIICYHGGYLQENAKEKIQSLVE